MSQLFKLARTHSYNLPAAAATDDLINIVREWGLDNASRYNTTAALARDITLSSLVVEISLAASTEMVHVQVCLAPMATAIANPVGSMDSRPSMQGAFLTKESRSATFVLDLGAEKDFGLALKTPGFVPVRPSLFIWTHAVADNDYPNNHPFITMVVRMDVSVTF